MASAEHLLNEAQYAFQSISVGDTRENRRNTARAKSLCKKIFRRHPGTSEAVVAHGIMMRLGEEAFESNLAIEHQHETHATAHDSQSPVSKEVVTANDETVLLDWAGLIAVILATSKTVLAVIAFFAIFLFGIFGPFLLLPLIAFVLLTGPFRKLLNPKQRRDMNVFVIRANAYIEEQRKSGTGFK